MRNKFHILTISHLTSHSGFIFRSNKQEHSDEYPNSSTYKSTYWVISEFVFLSVNIQW